MTTKNLKALKGLDAETVAQAIEADAGQAVPGLRESLAEAQAGNFAATFTLARDSQPQHEANGTSKHTAPMESDAPLYR